MSNYTFRSNDEALLRRIRDEYIEYVGREANITGDTLTVFDRPQKKPTTGKRTRPEEDKEVKTGPRYTKREKDVGVIPRT